MTREELKSNLGTIARSGSKAFLEELQQGATAAAGGDAADKDKDKDGSPAAGVLDGIIGQFGVGFYSAFMVGDTVEVYTRSARDGTRSVWSSDGSGEFVVREAEPLAEGEEEMSRGCKVVIKLRDGCEEYATQVGWRGGDAGDSVCTPLFVVVGLKGGGEGGRAGMLAIQACRTWCYGSCCSPRAPLQVCGWGGAGRGGTGRCCRVLAGPVLA